MHDLITVDGIKLEGILNIPDDAKGLVIFVHGSGSSRLSSRNTYVAEVLQQAGFATLLFDLLTEEEDRVYENRFNIDLLTDRLKTVTEWVKTKDNTGQLVVSYFGASTGAAAAIKAAADFGKNIRAIVSRGGRPDLAGNALGKIKSPALLIVGGDDDVVIELNKQACGQIANAEHKLSIVPHATHLFEEPGALEQVAKLAADWFKKYAERKGSGFDFE